MPNTIEQSHPQPELPEWQRGRLINMMSSAMDLYLGWGLNSKQTRFLVFRGYGVQVK